MSVTGPVRSSPVIVRQSSRYKKCQHLFRARFTSLFTNKQTNNTNSFYLYRAVGNKNNMSISTLSFAGKGVLYL